MTSRRAFVQTAASAVLVLAAGGAPAAAYPERPVKIVVGFPPGQTTDLTARMLAEKMTTALGKTVFVENRAGAGGILGHELVKAAPPDGYTLLITSSGPIAINPALYSKLPYSPLRDFAPIVLVNKSAMYLAARTTLPVSSAREMIAYVKARPGKLTYGSAGSGVTGHLAMEMLKEAAGLDLMHVPYKGSGPMITALIAGEIDFCIEPSTTMLPHGRSGRVKLLAITSAKRSDVTPEIQTIGEEGVPDYEATTFAGIVAPAGTPAPILDTLNRVINSVLELPEVATRIRNNGSTPGGGTRAEFEQLIRTELVRWGRAVKASGAQVD